jgi:hypothetical protein
MPRRAPRTIPSVDRTEGRPAPSAGRRVALGAGLVAAAVALTVAVVVRDGNDDVASPTDSIVPITAVYEGVEFFPACGNETLSHLGVTWYPIQRDPSVGEAMLEAIERVDSVEREQPPVGIARGLAGGFEPRPGDDVGTLVIWADGVAMWFSDSGNLGQFLVDDEMESAWMC